MPEPWGAQPPVAMPRGPGEGGGNGGMGAPYTPGGPYQPNNNLLAPHDPSRGASIRRTSSGSTGSYDIHIEPPSRPESSLGGQQDDATGYFLSPHHAPQPLPPQQQHSQPLPVRPRVGAYDSNGMDTEPNSPVDNNAYRHLPPNFIPQTLTDNRGISTPISHPGVLPGMGPVIPPPVMPSGPPSKAAPIYGNPNRERDREEGDSPPLSALASRSPFIPPAVLGGIGGSSPSTGGAWGAPGRVGSLGSGPGMTPATTTRDLPGGGRSGVSIYGPPVGVGGYSPNGPGPMPPAPYLNHNHEDEEDNGFDPTTTQNTRLNATIGQRKATPLRRR
ncbi:hypothetical protein BDZ97DRAFT_1800600 [Flammula alnicola]|nr:hypothetical protein BDZ97DRAFT_1800600 [Flammula alnicola]